MKKLAFIGAGSMAEALISGMVENKLLEPQNIWVTNRSNEERLNELKTKYGVSTSYDTADMLKEVDAVLLAMKPKDAAQSLTAIKHLLSDRTMLISVLAGVSLVSMEKLVGKAMPIVRAMPNTSAAIGKSATGFAVNEHVSAEQIELVQKILQTAGIARLVQEEQLDAVTGLSGSGPAYIYYLFEAMEKSAVDLGLEADLAKDFIVQTLMGAAEMLATSTKSASQLRKEVTSPGGTTEAGLNILAEHEVDKAVMECIKTAAEKSKSMGKVISEEIEAKLP
ncbi:pyrroline-5-carboxylate reductase [Bacillus benzoevorans]|uniref:Pyrroline-5-carboxylate reductase n=1 Tax=Bacillus benzoevorans TaxID=1456 RepID=A0A7X0LVP4_9BACI|nr:pyrroline-5-carboxylate reductase [Bacillus benzoevorans]MBB6444792.1 pyrroline-5-carboxylate reductase [Bacillus benzoevorans]